MFVAAIERSEGVVAVDIGEEELSELLYLVFPELNPLQIRNLERIQEIQLSSSDEGNKKSTFSLIPKSSTTKNTSVIPIF